MLIGITRIENAIVRDILRPYENEYSFYYFGERTNGTFTLSSDLNILVKGEKEMPLSLIYKLEEKCSLTHLGYEVNFINYSDMDKATYKSIEKELIPVFDKE